MRAVLVAAAGAAIVLCATACGSGQSGRTYPVSVYVAGKHFATVAPGDSGSFDRTSMTTQIGLGQVILHVDDTAARVLIDAALAEHAGRVDIPFTAVSSFIKADSQKQLYAHGSEITALSMLLSADRIDASQVNLLQELARSGPADPQPIAGSKLFRWGDPDQGFVGRPNRPGPRGGFGVYEKPIQQLSGKVGVRLVNFDGKSVAAVRAALLDGHPIIAWVDWTGAGKTSSWLTPSGKKITVNLGERAILLTGVGPGYYLLNDPVSGKEYKWSASRFTTRWALLGSRALELP